MIKIDKPNMEYGKIFDLCIGSLRESKFKELLILNRSKFVEASTKFNELGESHKLNNFKDLSSRVTNNKDEKKEIVNLYEKFKRNKSVSGFYDKLMASSKRCVYCNKGFTKTLDHYLPKSNFPLVSIEPSNLIPCCYDCNSTLNALSQNKQSHRHPLLIHPYFNTNNSIYEEQWIFADIPNNQPFFDKTNPDFSNLILDFYTDFENTNIDNKLRPSLEFQFEHLMLENYADTVVEIIPSELTRLRMYRNTSNQLISVNRSYLISRARMYQKNNINSPAFIIYNTLANSQLYLRTIENEFF